MTDFVLADQPYEVPSYDTAHWTGRTSDACVVIPVINEGERIARLLARMKAIGVAGIADIIIVDGGSKDGSLDPDKLEAGEVAGLLVKRGPGKLSSQLRCAYDFVLRRGYGQIVTIDGNDKDRPDPIATFIQAVKNGADFVQASRFVKGGVAENTPFKRWVAIRMVHAPMLSFASGFRWTDTTQGFRAYSRRLLTDPRVAIFRNVFRDYELLAYLSYRAPKLRFRCVELPTERLYPAGEKIPTKISVKGEFAVLDTLVKTCRGKFDPVSRPS
jgi:dolichol-phosphate mannosyltransferase